MKKQVLFIHSAGPQKGKRGSSHLIAYLQNSLSKDYHFSSPAMPNPENPSYAAWKAILKKKLSELKGNVVLIGHSLGGSVLLKYLSEEACDLSISGLFVMGSPYWGLDKEWLNQEFELSNDFALRVPQISQIYLYQSRNDEVVPFSHFEYYAYKLPHAKTRVFENYGHLFQDDLPELVHDIESTR
ncbi:alpha/beta fold hydrolase [Sediminibacillus massiliensis]|uniref:alpha/beta fold hydrolase n=1 Tax=Sediminibacillus massiliensis TaxID=1926277 RepID=UPI000988903E|nr:alpha/beta fold hydrolase [Sediminibacillus massiliensis]